MPESDVSNLFVLYVIVCLDDIFILRKVHNCYMDLGLPLMFSISELEDGIFRGLASTSIFRTLQY